MEAGSCCQGRSGGGGSFTVIDRLASRGYREKTQTGAKPLIEKLNRDKKPNTPQRLLVFQQKGSGESKIKGIRQYGQGLFAIEIIDIDRPLPTIIEDSRIYLPQDFSTDLVLDFLKHPDLSYDLSRICKNKNVPIIASGKKLRDKWAITPPT